MTITDAAKALEVSTTTIYRMIEDGRLRALERPHVKLRGGRVRVLTESVEQYLPQPPARRIAGETEGPGA